MLWGGRVVWLGTECSSSVPGGTQGRRGGKGAGSQPPPHVHVQSASISPPTAAAAAAAITTTATTATTATATAAPRPRPRPRHFAHSHSTLVRDFANLAGSAAVNQPPAAAAAAAHTIAPVRPLLPNAGDWTGRPRPRPDIPPVLPRRPPADNGQQPAPSLPRSHADCGRAAAHCAPHFTPQLTRQDVGITPRSKSRQNRSRLGMASESPTRSDSKLDDEEGVVTAVTDLLATNQKLRRTVKLKDAEISAMRADLERAQEEIQALRKTANAQAEEMTGMRRALEKARLKRKGTADGGAGGGGGGGGGRADGGGEGGGPRRKHLPLSSERNEVDPTTGAVSLAESRSRATPSRITESSDDLCDSLIRPRAPPSPSASRLPRPAPHPKLTHPFPSRTGSSHAHEQAGVHRDLGGTGHVAVLPGGSPGAEVY